MILPVTLTAAALAALINIWLATRVGQVRGSEKVSIGDGGNDKVVRRMRAHANFTEFTPFVLILIAGIELAAGTSVWLWAVAGLYMVGRIAHGIGMDEGKPGRGVGIGVTLLTLAGLAIWALYIAFASDGAIEAGPPADAPAAEVVPQG